MEFIPKAEKYNVLTYFEKNFQNPGLKWKDIYIYIYVCIYYICV